MIRIKKGFQVDLEHSTGVYVNVNSGSLYDDNSKMVYSFTNKKFKKMPSTTKYVYFDIMDDNFKTFDEELNPVLLDTTYETFCPICYMKTDSLSNIIDFRILTYGYINVTPPGTGSGGDYRPIKFITESFVQVEGTSLILKHDIYVVIDLFIYEKGEVMLSTIDIDGNMILLQEDVSPALCEITYGYLA